MSGVRFQVSGFRCQVSGFRCQHCLRLNNLPAKSNKKL
ncbi:hypothetical protein D1AOALGA4SA_7200 [Olavius algarvensis Delta 1 endosymbiont]|nr:hypothetical protein D1AOALGA4SA_7200 [Olavius algarvensis Delta 1 endosymbiont]